MSEVVGYGDSARGAEDFETAVNSAELREVLGNALGACAEVMSNRCRRKSVVDIVSAWYHKLDFGELFASVHKVKLFVNTLICADVGGIVVVRIVHTEAELFDFDILETVDGILVVAVVDNELRGLVSEFVERLLDIVEVLEIVEVVCVDVEYNRDIRRHLKEGVHVLARFAHDDIAVTDVAVAADERKLAADNRRGVEARAD